MAGVARLQRRERGGAAPGRAAVGPAHARSCCSSRSVRRSPPGCRCCSPSPASRSASPPSTWAPAVTPLSVWSMNFSMMIGLAVGIDYSLFIVSRYREEREDGRDALDARRRHAGHRGQGRVPLRAHRRAVAGRGVPGAGHGVPVDGARHDPVGRRHRRRLAHPAARRPRRPRRPGARGQGPQATPTGPPRAVGPDGPPRPCAGPGATLAAGLGLLLLLAAPAARHAPRHARRPGRRRGPAEPRRLRAGRRVLRSRRRRPDVRHRPGRRRRARSSRSPAPTPASSTPGSSPSRRRSGRTVVRVTPTTAVDDQATSELVGRLRDRLDTVAPTPPSAAPAPRTTT